MHMGTHTVTCEDVGQWQVRAWAAWCFRTYVLGTYEDCWQAMDAADVLTPVVYDAGYELRIEKVSQV